MEEKSKRVRPTVAQMRSLETELKNALGHAEELQNAVVFLEHKCEELEKAKVESETRYGQQLEGTSKLVMDCDDWREKYRALAENRDSLKREVKGKEAEISHLKMSVKDKDRELDKVRQLSKEMEKELGRIREQAKVLGEKDKEARREIQWLYARNLWQRITNKQF